MSVQRSIGLTSLKIGAIAGDGGMGASLTQVNTVKDTVKITSSDPDIKEFYEEEVTDPVYVITTKDPSLTLEFSIYDIQPDTLISFFGGTKAGTPEVWTPPATYAQVEKSIEITSLTGVVLKIVRAKLLPQFDWNVSRQELSMVKIKAVILTPTKAATAAYTITMPAA